MPTPTIAVAIPCHNEAPAVAPVVAAWRAALPEAEVVVFDNDSTDGTGQVARGLGVRVVEVPERGKGHAVRAMFRELKDVDVMIMVDGDGTYPAEYARALAAPILDGSAEMAVGARRPAASAGAMSPVRGVGNVLIRMAFHALIGRPGGDLLSGYRAFSRRFRAEVAPRASGFEIEAELAGEAVLRGYRVVEVEVPYLPRVAGTASKLRAFRDGRRIVGAIAGQAARHRPWRVAGLGAIGAGVVGGIVAAAVRLLR